MKKLLLALATLFALSGSAVAQNYGPGPQPVPIGTVQVIGQQSLPMVLLGSATYGNNGAATLTTALAATPAIANAVVYVPAHSISSTLPAAAGWFYATFSSATALTIFNNPYTSGTPVFPPSPTAFVTTGNGAVAGVSSAVTAYSLSIPGNSLGLNGGLRIQSAITYTNSAANKIMELDYGASMTVWAVTATTTLSMPVLLGFNNTGVTGAQIANIPEFATTLFAAGTGVINSGTTDSTTAQTLKWTLTNATPATNNIILLNTKVELLPSVP